MSRTKRQMQRLLDRYTNLQLDFDDWMKKNINPKRDVRADERDGTKVAKIGVGRQEPYVEGGVLRDITERVPLSYLTLKEQNALIRELDERGYFDDDKRKC